MNNSNLDLTPIESIVQAKRKPTMDHERIEIDLKKGAKPTRNK